MPVRPEDLIGFDVQVHGINAHIGITLERLLIYPVGRAGVQATNLIVVSDVEHLSVAV